VANMVAAFREVKRVLRDDGQLFLNIGDTRSKDRQWLGIPQRLVLALQADGWRWEDEIVWAKKNPMPSSQTNRFTRSHEMVYMLNKSKAAFFDLDAVREGDQVHHRKAGGYHGRNGVNASRFYGKGGFGDSDVTTIGRNRRTVWSVATQPYSGAHFATFPEALVEPTIKAGTSERGCCPECGKQWERVTEPTPEYQVLLSKANDRGDWYERNTTKDKRTDGTKHGKQRGGILPDYKTTGFSPTCAHTHDPQPCTVLDPFAGSGTVGLVARRLGRHFVGIDLSPEYLQLARQRLELDRLEAWTNGKQTDDEDYSGLPLLEGAL
jgi:DNA modification methylase